MGGLRIDLLGGFAAFVDGDPVADGAWRLKKARELVKLLALAPGHRLHREQAMDVLWRDRDPRSAANNLNQAVHVARRALGAAAIDVHDESLHLAAEVDVDGFERAAADARRAGTPAALRAALASYRGELLPENRYDDWAIDRRDQLGRLQAELAEALSAAGEEAELRRLPADVSSFVGRERELGELRALLRGTRLLTLAGTGGVGKTRLALELARSVSPAYSGGTALVELASVSDPSLVTGSLATALDLRALPEQALVDVVADFLAPRTLLLVLDNCEHVLAAASELADTLLRAAPRLTVVATSREPLRVAGEVVFRVPSLAIPDPDEPHSAGDLMRYEAIRLFVDRATAAAPKFSLADANAADVARICFRLDGLPLALELAAGRLGALGPGAIADRLDDRFRLLRAGSSGAPSRQQTLEATLEWSHDLLQPDERNLFRRLAVFAGGFELEAVEEVCPGGELAAVEIADVLARLVEKSLVAADDWGAGRRYRLLETVRVYASQRLVEAGEADEAAVSHARWALALAQRERDSVRLDREEANLRAAHRTLLARAPDDALRFCVALWPFWLRRIDLAEADARFTAALAAAPERSALRAEALLAAAATLFRAGSRARGVERGEESLAIARELGDLPAEWRAVQHLGEQYGIAGDMPDVAAEWFERGRELARRQGFEAGEALSVYSLGIARWFLGDAAGGARLIERSLTSFRALSGSPERIPSPVNIHELRNDVGEGAGLRIVFEETLQPFVEISCEVAVGYVLANQAMIARIRGDVAAARKLLEECAEHFETIAHERGQVDVLVRRAYLELDEGSLDAARAHLDEALELRRRLNDRRGLGLVLTGLGLIETAAGDYDLAERRLAESLDLFRRAGDRWGLANALWRIADLAFARERIDEAEAALEEARTVLSMTQRERWIAHTVAGLAEVAVLRGDRERARELFADARDRYASRHDDQGVTAVEARLRALAKPPLSEREEGARRTSATQKRKEGTHD